MNAQRAGASAVIVYNNVDGPPFAMTDGGDYGLATQVTIPVVGISHADGKLLAAAIEAGRASISLKVGVDLMDEVRVHERLAETDGSVVG